MCDFVCGVEAHRCSCLMLCMLHMARGTVRFLQKRLFGSKQSPNMANICPLYETLRDLMTP